MPRAVPDGPRAWPPGGSTIYRTERQTPSALIVGSSSRDWNRGTDDMRCLILLAVALGAASCGGADDRDPAWSYVSPAIMQPNCATASCHNQLAAVAGLDLSTKHHGYVSLTALTLPTGQYAEKPRQLVVPGNPDQSRLVRMLRADGAERMPPDRALAEADIRLVERWILNGAHED
jgi:hypothetical protein